MKTKYATWEYKPDNGGEIEKHNILTLFWLLNQQGFSVNEAQKVIFAPAQEVVHIRKCGDFRRIS